MKKRVKVAKKVSPRIEQEARTAKEASDRALLQHSQERYCFDLFLMSQ